MGWLDELFGRTRDAIQAQQPRLTSEELDPARARLIADKIGQTWPYRMAATAWNAPQLMGDIMYGRSNIESDAAIPGTVPKGTQDRTYEPNWLGEKLGMTGTWSAPGEASTIGRAANLAGMLMGGGLPMAERGAAGIFGGRLAKTAPLDQLAKAEEMAGRDASPIAIQALTGWSRGADGKWRFEISDRGLAPTQQGKTFGDMWAAAGGGQQARPIKELFQHPELEAAYPGYGKLNISPLNTSDPNHRGRFYNGTISLNPSLSNKEIRDVIIHELQHPIQAVEGFASGTNYSAMSKAAEKALGMSFSEMSPTLQDKAMRAAYEAYRRHAGEVEARAAAERANMFPWERRFSPPQWNEDVPRADQIVRGVKSNAAEEATASVGRTERFNWPVRTEYGKTIDMPVTINPSRGDVMRELSTAPHGDVRALKAPDGSIYLWPANEAMHIDIANTFDLPFKTRQQLQSNSYLFNKNDVERIGKFSSFDEMLKKLSTLDQLPIPQAQAPIL